MVHVLCFGNLQLDILCRPVIVLPPPGTLRQIESIDQALSGNGGNVAAALGQLGISVELAGYSGSDVIGEQFRVMLERMGVGTDKLLRHPDAPTGISIVALSPEGERSVLFVNGANASFDLTTVPTAWLSEARVVSLSSVFVLPQFTGQAVGQLFARAKRQGATTVLNSSWDARGLGLPFLKPALAETDYFILSHDEGCQITQQEPPQAILAALAGQTPGTVILTLGPSGCCLQTEDGFQHIPAVPVQAVDSTGAGDSFTAGFIAGLMSGYSCTESARLGCQVAAFAITGPGAYTRIPPLAEIEAHGNAENAS